MEDVLISIETAKLAKEKGFNDRCLNRYSLGNNEVIFDDKKHWNTVVYKFGEFCSAPTQAHLQKWLRETHGINISVIPRRPHSDWQGEIGYQLISLIKDEQDEGDVYPFLAFFMKDDRKIFDTYEEAMEKGLEYSLKYIQ